MTKVKGFFVDALDLLEVVFCIAGILLFAMIFGLHMLLKKIFSKKAAPATKSISPNINALCHSQHWTWDPYNFRIYPDPGCYPRFAVTEGQLIDSFRCCPDLQKLLAKTLLEISLHPSADSGGDPRSECISNIDPAVALKLEQLVHAEIYFIQQNGPLRMYRPATLEIEKRRFRYATRNGSSETSVSAS